MTEITDLLQQLADPALSDAEACATSDQLATAIDHVMRGAGHIAAKIEAIRIAERLGWDGLLPGYLAVLAAEAGAS